MHRFYTKPENISDTIAVVLGQDVSHIRTVLRLKKGDRVQILDGCGNCYKVTITNVGFDRIESHIDSKDNVENCESPLTICLGQGIVKGFGFDGIVRRAVELGVNQVIPVKAQRCISKISSENITKKNTRWQRIAREASKQCGRNVVPDILDKPLSVDNFCYNNRECELKLIFWEEERSTRIKDLPTSSILKSAAVLIGPEGGFAASEIQSAVGYGFRRISLGPRLLRTDTAPLAVLSILQNHWGDL